MDIVYLGRILVCFILSFFIGLERQWHRRITGLRTNVLVCLGSFLFTYIAVCLNIASDSTRIAAQVVSGIGFLGAGVILKDGGQVTGLNTAATLWCNAAIGVLCAYGLLEEAIVGTAFILISNILLRKLNIKMLDSDIQNNDDYIITLVCKEKFGLQYRKEITNWIEKNNLLLKEISCYDTEEGKVKIKTYLSARDINEVEKIVHHFSVDSNVASISFKILSEDFKKAVEADEV